MRSVVKNKLGYFLATFDENGQFVLLEAASDIDSVVLAGLLRTDFQGKSVFFTRFYERCLTSDTPCAREISSPGTML